ncbi:hypothetical protein A3724_15440 [Alcanivorax sp. HI0033]|nr:hypothetical protein A3713_12630 [Alcanivorax sp. HI0003]KZX71870.1 hypothetical protein A3714_04600 [Alcanivorax sp. HI0007]KZX79612.1 hypothetical protein A3716_01085 [Alcanivorax sp. HI0011]KZX89502.1 hypothetical protein A3717_04880 [Alcanivorax sp. HI0013]KZY10220.1 hypothetical protein A3724_15440 [Alcanivorax sp. HI0033]KZY12265.1 hypothetical protein A3725_14075 [Alcanivorax sp. HI0035]MBB09833.1 hypothetical protein [Alcanivorax sp.]
MNKAEKFSLDSDEGTLGLFREYCVFPALYFHQFMVMDTIRIHITRKGAYQGITLTREPSQFRS